MVETEAYFFKLFVLHLYSVKKQTLKYLHYTPYMEEQQHMMHKLFMLII